MNLQPGKHDSYPTTLDTEKSSAIALLKHEDQERKEERGDK